MKHLRRLGSALVVGVVASLAVPAAAYADVSGDGPEDATVTTVAGASLEEAALDARESSGDAGKVFRDERAREGRLVDASETSVAMVDGLTVVWEDGVEVQSVEVAEGNASPSGSSVEEVAVEASLDGGEVATVLEGAGLSMASGSNLKGGKLISSGCVTTTTRSVNRVTNCYEKYKLTQKSGTWDQYYYSRWATAVGGRSMGPWHFKPVNMDVRSRPSASYPGRIPQSGLTNYWPKSNKNICQTAGTFGFEYAGFKLSVPVSSCEGLNPIPNSTTNEMGVTWSDGKPYTGAISKGVDFGMVVKVKKAQTPYFGDYTYARFCDDIFACGISDGNLRKDGW